MSPGPHRPSIGQPSIGHASASFDPQRGWGTVVGADGTEYGFHATAIADGTRRIDPGTAVAFAVRPGHRGLYEASGLTRV